MQALRTRRPWGLRGATRPFQLLKRACLSQASAPLQSIHQHILAPLSFRDPSEVSRPFDVFPAMESHIFRRFPDLPVSLHPQSFYSLDALLSPRLVGLISSRIRPWDFGPFEALSHTDCRMVFRPPFPSCGFYHFRVSHSRFSPLFQSRGLDDFRIRMPPWAFLDPSRLLTSCVLIRLATSQPPPHASSNSASRYFMPREFLPTVKTSAAKHPLPFEANQTSLVAP